MDTSAYCAVPPPRPPAMPQSAEDVEDPREALRVRNARSDDIKYVNTLTAYYTQQLVLKFLIWMQESVVYSPLESTRVRLARLEWFVEDNTSRIVELKEENSGIQGGLFLARGKHVTDTGLPLDGRMMRIGGTFQLNGIVWHVADADERTHAWLRRTMNVELGPAQKPPATWHAQATRRAHRWDKPTVVSPGPHMVEHPTKGFYTRDGDARGPFLEFGTEALRFEAWWDDTCQPACGDVRRVLLSYYLADDTLEIFEPAAANDGKGDMRKVLARQRLPLSALQIMGRDAWKPCLTGRPRTGHSDASRLGIGATAGSLTNAQQAAAAAVAAVYHPVNTANTRSRATNPLSGLTMGASHEEGPLCKNGREAHATPTHLICGSVLGIWGRRLLLSRCDPATAEWYAQAAGVDQRQLFDSWSPLQDLPAWARAGRSARPANPIPRTHRVPPRASTALAGHVLHVPMKAEQLADGGVVRTFLMQIWLEDGKAAVQETTAVRGWDNGKFLERGVYNIIVMPSVPSSGTVSPAPERAVHLPDEERDIGAGGTGVALIRSVGFTGDFETSMAELTSTMARAVGSQPLRPELLQRGARFAFSHSPRQVFVVTGDCSDPARRAPALPPSVAGLALPVAAAVCALAKAVDGKFASLAATVTSTEAVESRAGGWLPGTGTLSRDAAQHLLAECGLAQHHIDELFKVFVVPEPAAPGYGELKLAPNPLVGRIQMSALLRAGVGAAGFVGDQAYSIDDRMDELRKALLSSRSHLLECFRDLGSDLPGVITEAEFKLLLQRHHLDVGLSAAEVAAFGAKFPAADEHEISHALRTHPAAEAKFHGRWMSWTGFVRTLVSHIGLTEQAVQDLLDLLSTVGRWLAGAGEAPEMFAHAPTPPLLPTAHAAYKGVDGAMRQREARLERAAEPAATTYHSPAKEPAEDADLPASRVSVDTATEAAEAVASLAGGVRRIDSILTHSSDVIARVAQFFRRRQPHLLRTMQLFDTSGQGLLPVAAMTEAIQAAGFRMAVTERHALARGLEAMLDETDSRQLLSYRSVLHELFETFAEE